MTCLRKTEGVEGVHWTFLQAIVIIVLFQHQNMTPEAPSKGNKGVTGSGSGEDEQVCG